MQCLSICWRPGESFANMETIVNLSVAARINWFAMHVRTNGTQKETTNKQLNNDCFFIFMIRFVCGCHRLQTIELIDIRISYTRRHVLIARWVSWLENQFCVRMPSQGIGFRRCFSGLAYASQTIGTHLNERASKCLPSLGVIKWIFCASRQHGAMISSSHP